MAISHWHASTVDYTEKQATVRSFIQFRENMDKIITASVSDAGTTMMSYALPLPVVTNWDGVLKARSIEIASRRGKTNIRPAGRTQNVSRLWNTIVSQNDFIESMVA